jgi:hypothetical protein
MELEFMKMKIEAMTKVNQIEVLRILKASTDVRLNENKSGVFVNMSFLPENALGELVKYIQYVEEQEETLKTAENQKEDFKSEYFD